MKKIGFIDYYIANWHSNNYPNWIKQASVELGLDYKVCYAYAKIDQLKDGDSQMTTDEWCKKFEVEQCNSIEEIIEKSDCLVVLSPNNPEYHEELCALPLKSGKPVYVDKTFAPDAASAKRIVDLAEQSNTPFFSTSALRFSDEMIALKETLKDKEPEYVCTTGGGIFSNYIVHQLEPITTVMGLGAQRVKCLKTSGGRTFIIEYAGNKKAVANQMPEMPFTIGVQTKESICFNTDINNNMFQNLVKTILRFFEDRDIPVCHKQTIEIMAIREAAFKAYDAEDTWVEVAK